MMQEPSSAPEGVDPEGGIVILALRMQASHLAAPTQLLWTDNGAAISMKLTRGCGSLGAASPALGACRSSRLLKRVRKTASA